MKKHIKLTVDTHIKDNVGVNLNQINRDFVFSNREYPRTTIDDSVEETGKQDTLRRDIYTKNGVEFVINFRRGSVRTPEYWALEPPETLVFKDVENARKCTYKARRSSAYGWLEREK